MLECEQQLIDAIDANIAKCIDRQKTKQRKKLQKFRKEIIKLWLKEQH